ncbi:hypothetical protein BASA61_009353 [Batrachochytrium salamandrivorans]|nr:hypothetical protein BASA61_009353 [Batrachochytrium salamandrivorans]
MLCLHSFLFLFMIPFPQVSTLLLLLYLLMLAVEHKPCIYCSLLILVLMTSSCSFYGNKDTGDRCWLDLDSEWMHMSRLSNMVYGVMSSPSVSA